MAALLRTAPDHDLHLTGAGIRAGVWVDVGQWSGEGDYAVLASDSPPVLMWKGHLITAEMALQRGWILPLR